MPTSKPKIMAILNLTPDSFSDGGQYNEPEDALKRAHQLIEQGADIIDIGGESSGPNSPDVSEEEEYERVIPVLQKLGPGTKIPISIDTYKSKIANEALKLGATIINDVTAFRGDPKMAETVAHHNARVVLMYSKDPTARTTIKQQEYDDVITTIANFFIERIAYAKSKGIKTENIILDPGMGHFVSSDPKYSFEIIERLPELIAKFSQHQFLLGISRKSFLGGKISERDELAKSLTALAIKNGASIIRKH